MKEKLHEILVEEKIALSELLEKLTEQHKFVASNNVIGMEQCVKDIEEVNRMVAKAELDRRKLLGECSMSEIISNLRDEELDNIFRDIKKILQELQTQRETNQILIRQGLSLTNSLLTAIKPQEQKRSNTYNSYGKVKR